MQLCSEFTELVHVNHSITDCGWYDTDQVSKDTHILCTRSIYISPCVREGVVTVYERSPLYSSYFWGTNLNSFSTQFMLPGTNPNFCSQCPGLHNLGNPRFVIPNPWWWCDNKLVFCPKGMLRARTTLHHEIFSTGVGSVSSHTRECLAPTPVWPPHIGSGHTKKKKIYHDVLGWRNYRRW